MSEAPRKYVYFRDIKAVLAELGYKEEPIATRENGMIHFAHDRKEYRHLPERITIAFPSVLIGGDLGYKRELVFDLLDRLSDGPSESGEDEIVIKALRSLN